MSLVYLPINYILNNTAANYLFWEILFIPLGKIALSFFFSSSSSPSSSFFFFPSLAGHHLKFASHYLIQCSHFDSSDLFFCYVEIMTFKISGACWERLSWWWHALATAAARPSIYLSYHSARFRFEELINDHRGQIICRLEMKSLLGNGNLIF